MGKYLKIINLILILFTLPVYGNIEEAQKIFDQNFEEGDFNTDNIKTKLQSIDASHNEAANYAKNSKKPKLEQAEISHLLSPKSENIDSKHYFKGEEKSDEYNALDMGESITSFSAMKAISSPMKDSLGGIGQNSNPTVMQGKCQRCSIKGGSFIHDCCNLRGIAEGLLGGCKQEEKDLANASIKDKRCHLIQEKYCSKRKLTVCLERKTAYCCYGSQMAKIIQEIAHQQLNLSWGEGDKPNCTSLTADQLSRLDFNSPFARGKLSELVSEYQTAGAKNASQFKNKVGDLQAKLSQQYKNPVNRPKK
jgi:hypothetical protein